MPEQTSVPTKRRDIRVPKFSLEAGGALMTVERRNDWSDIWDIRCPNNVGVDDSLTYRTESFDDIRGLAEELAVVFEEAESRYQSARKWTIRAVNAAYENHKRGATDEG